MVEPSHVNCASGVIGRRCLSLAAYSALLAAPAYMAFRPSAATAQARSALDLMRLAPSVSYFAEIVKNHGLEEEFSAAGDFGFFIPLNGAIEQVPALQVERFRRDREYARQIVLNHITDFGDVINGFSGVGGSLSQRVRTKAGHTLTLVYGSGPPRIAGYTITYTNIRASNGYCHALDGVLLI
jgi:uncharacterized surface protein with fasciclin (FAS1) repeats